MEEIIDRLSPQLFWDVDPRTIDIEKNASWLLARVLQRGTWEDWQVISKLYGRSTLRDLATSLKVDEKSANFLRIYCQQ